MYEEKELRNLFNRILFTSVFGLVIAHLSHFKNPFFISFHSVIIAMTLKRYNIKILIEKISIVCAGIFLGVVATEIFTTFPLLQSILVYTIFMTTLKLFAHDYKADVVYMFTFSFIYASIFSSYLEAEYQIEALQYMWQMLWVFIIITVTFKLFPSNMKVVKVQPLEKSKVKNWKVCFFSLILSLLWVFSMLFEWRFAFFAYACLIALFKGFDMHTINFKATENIKVHFKACLITAVFSVLLYGMVGNVLLMTLGLLLIFIPVIRNAIYSNNSKKMYSNFTLIIGLIVPLTLYINLDGAAVYKSLLRSTMITLVMLLILFISKLLPYNILSK